MIYPDEISLKIYRMLHTIVVVVVVVTAKVVPYNTMYFLWGLQAVLQALCVVALGIKGALAKASDRLQSA